MHAKKLIAIAAIVLGALLASTGAFAGGAKARGPALTPLSEAEIATLQWMREEEKLARDVYLELNLFWPAKVFTNIAASEQKHFDAIGKKLTIYGVADTALPGIGTYSDPRLQAYHDELLALGMVSYVEALKVGVIIEKQDILDLEAAIDGTASRPLQTTYGHLLAGSRNHLRSFEKLLAK